MKRKNILVRKIKVLILDTCVLILFMINNCSAQNVLDGVYVSNNDSIELNGKYKPSITGTVSDAKTKNPIEGALIELKFANEPIVKVYSGVNGYFSFSNIDLTDRIYTIKCIKKEYQVEEVKTVSDNVARTYPITFYLREK